MEHKNFLSVAWLHFLLLGGNTWDCYFVKLKVKRMTHAACSKLAVRHQKADTSFQGLQPGLVPVAATCIIHCFLYSNVYLIRHCFIACLMAATQCSSQNSSTQSPNGRPRGLAETTALPVYEGRGTEVVVIPILSGVYSHSEQQRWVQWFA